MTGWVAVLDVLPYLVITSLLGLVITHYRKVQNGRLIPRITVDLMVQAAQDDAKTAHQDAAERVIAMREELNRRMDGYRADQAAAVERTADAYRQLIAAKDAEIERLSMQLNLESEANRQSVESTQEQVGAAARLVTAMAHGLQEARRQIPEVVVNGPAGSVRGEISA